MWHHLSIKNKHSQRAALILQKYTLSKGCPLIIFRMVLIARGKERKLVVEITGKEWKNSSRKNEEAEPKQEQDPVVMRLVVKVKSVAIKNSTA